MVIGSGITPNVKYRIKESKPVNQETHQRVNDNGFQHSCKRNYHVRNCQAINRPLEPKHKRKGSRMGFSPLKCAITAVALQVGCSYLQTQGPTEQRPNGRKSHPSLATLELTAPKTYTGSRLPAQGMYTSAQHCLQFLRQQFSRESYGSKARSETTAETNCPAYFCLPLTAYSKGLESLASKNNLYQ
jgi:hypothetical protein